MNNKYVNTNDNVNIVEISCRLVSAKKFESGAGFITGYVKNGTDVFPRIYCPKEVYKEFKKHSRIKSIFNRWGSIYHSRWSKVYWWHRGENKH